ncbi:MAG: ABC transporter substrate-binding protein [Patescibacteria group bacterium]
MRTGLKKIKDHWKFLRSLSTQHWRHLLRGLTRGEINLILFWLGLAIVSLGFMSGYDYWALRIAAPAAGGNYSEGLVGEPRYLNPILASTNEVDRDIATLIFSGLVKHDNRGQIIPDLAESYKISADGKTYEFTLRDKLFWPDNKPLTSDDVVFTLNLIKDGKYQSPLRNNWQGIKIEKIDDKKLNIKLPVEYEPFLENATVGILPQHLWVNIQPQNFLLTQLNTKPIGLGQYQLTKITKNAAGSVRSMELSPNPKYYQKANIAQLVLRFYENQENLISGYKRGEIDGFSLNSPKEKDDIKNRSVNFYNLKLPRYFAIFFNQTKSDVLSDVNVRKALAYATDRKTITEEILKSEAEEQSGPFPFGVLTLKPPAQTYEFNIESAENTLDKAGWKKSSENGIREKKLSGQKKVSPLEFTLTTTDWPELTQVASLLKTDWEKIGVKVNLDVVPVNAIQTQTIRPREYEALLFGEVLGLNPDPFSFWHSTQRKDPGLNLSVYSNKKVDGLLESARQMLSPQEKIKKYQEFQNIIMSDLPAIFLYSPNYIYAVSDKVRGFETEAINTPSQRFENINQWYIATKRVKKQ